VGEAVVAGGDAPEVLEAAEHALDFSSPVGTFEIRMSDDAIVPPMVV
jgi:hypothetical protein